MDVTEQNAADRPAGQRSIADIIERLFIEFDTRVPLNTIVTTVRRARRDIDITDGPALSELVERLARARLLRLAGTDGAS